MPPCVFVLSFPKNGNLRLFVIHEKLKSDTRSRKYSTRLSLTSFELELSNSFSKEEACQMIFYFCLGSINLVYVLVRHVPFIAKSAEESCTALHTVLF